MRLFTFSLTSVALVALLACGDVEVGSDRTSEPRLASNVCAGKACGADCSPPGSDEPFNCNAAGACVVSGSELSCDAIDAGPGPGPGVCDAEPACDEGHTKIDSSSACLQDDAVCYSRTACDITIWCTGPDRSTPGPTDAGAAP